MSISSPLPPQPARPESGAWDGVRAGWTHAYGGFDRLGVSVELHDFRADAELDWGRSFHPESVEICLNLAGTGKVEHGQQAASFQPNSAGFYSVAREPLRARRAAGEPHRFVTIEFRHDFLAQQLSGVEKSVDPLVQRGVFGRKSETLIAPSRALTPAQRAFAGALAQPPVAPAALPIWYQSKVLEGAALFLFAPEPEMFCARQKRVARERVERVCEILRARLEEPPALEELGREVGVSQFYLSRLFSQEMRMSIPQYLRRIRMERAAELLRQGRHNVTEAAFAVGYASLGHFSKSFCEVMGCCPTLYPNARNLVRG